MIINNYLTGSSIRSLAIKYSTTRHFIKKHLLANAVKLRTVKEQSVLQGLKQSGTNHPNWSTGIHFDKRHNEMKINIKGKYYKESHYNWCLNNGLLRIPKSCDIHHVNFNHLDNRPENLVLIPHDTHTSLHRKYQEVMQT